MAPTGEASVHVWRERRGRRVGRRRRRRRRARRPGRRRRRRRRARLRSRLRRKAARWQHVVHAFVRSGQRAAGCTPTAVLALVAIQARTTAHVSPAPVPAPTTVRLVPWFDRGMGVVRASVPLQRKKHLRGRARPAWHVLKACHPGLHACLTCAHARLHACMQKGLVAGLVRRIGCIECRQHSMLLPHAVTSPTAVGGAPAWHGRDGPGMNCCLARRWECWCHLSQTGLVRLRSSRGPHPSHPSAADRPPCCAPVQRVVATVALR